ncbi:MAG: divergent PAP2 family protein, partial [Candidatus Omnitrophica bacterium]|nr:divergent PAP2 family protein [Candidatus Omnitrophota bacterium]
MMTEIFNQIIKNKIFMTTLFAWAVAQTIKVSIGVIRERRFDFRWFVGTGGMPSSHATGASCLTTAIGLEYGFNSIYFALAASFAIIVMFDAQGVRRATGKQAHILNKVMEDIYWQGRIQENRLRELIG